MNKNIYKNITAAVFIFFCLATAVVTIKAEPQSFNRVIKPAASSSTQIKTARKKKKRKVKKPVSKSNSNPIASGNWGATGINFIVGSSSVRVEFDCADGQINQTPVIDGQGNFSLDGVYTPTVGGPTRIDQTAQNRPARFAGKVSGSQMTLNITLTDDNQNVGDFVLELDKTGRIRRCY